MTEKAVPFLLPLGRLINHALFVKEQFNEKATPGYKVELAFDDAQLDDVEAALVAGAIAEWGAGAANDTNLVMPFKDGKFRPSRPLREAGIRPCVILIGWVTTCAAPPSQRAVSHADRGGGATTQDRASRSPGVGCATA